VKESQRLRDKFNKISGHRRDATVKSLVKSAVLILANDDALTESQKEVLNLGPKFVPALRMAPIMDIITSVESVASRMNSSITEVSTAEKLRHDVSNVLMKYVKKKLPSNLTPQQNKSLKELQQNPDIKVIHLTREQVLQFLTVRTCLVK
jgi:hypothetical protein